ncbi:MAG: dTDP-4-dehydrorhamnose 3,5-epimerase family protein [Melioribacteraceae bacterium]|nr:dTDP-4-dehydrorhamnose 3,5-epimerase family protein [Melioribacteraceae bacterium]MCF8265929.1 dTDP-4-dehydrorhamnose 3,5-epimerase family protein [Melioribacteraceae bacterium]MCF8297957.1 dTDP-4-dehydrorhamnose 3,5-epimerase family protein [Saprospiraceae bacterium]
MNISQLSITDLFLIENFCYDDNRGNFVKNYNKEIFSKMKINFSLAETYYSVSAKNVIRGMHFQLPPFQHSKIISVVQGRILDVIIDLRKNSPTYLRIESLNLSENVNSLFIPPGCAHGFRSLQNNSIVLYQQSTIHSKTHDSGIRWNSIGFDWEIDEPIISEKDRFLQELNKFNTPFIYKENIQ